MRNFFHEINNETSCKEMRRFNENKAPQKSELLKTTSIFLLNFYAKQYIVLLKLPIFLAV